MNWIQWYYSKYGFRERHTIGCGSQWFIKYWPIRRWYIILCMIHILDGNSEKIVHVWRKATISKVEKNQICYWFETIQSWMLKWLYKKIFRRILCTFFFRIKLYAKEVCPFFIVYSLYENGHDFLDTC